MKILLKLLGALCAALAFGSALAQGVSGATISIGQTGALSGPADEIGKEAKAGVEAYFNAVNEAGGIGGRKLRLVSLDDAGDTDKAKANLLKLATEEGGVLALVAVSGDAALRASWGLFEKNKLPLIGSLSGEPSLFETHNRYIINLRASYAQEAERIVDQLAQRKITKIALFYQNDALGRGGLAAVDAALRARKSSIVLFGSVDRNSTNVATAAQNLHKSGAEAVIISAGARPAAAFVREIKKLGSQAQLFALSSVGAKAFAAQAGDDGRGVGVSQVMPLPTAESEALTREYIKHIGGLANVSFASLEAYVAARILVEGIRKSGKVPTRESLIDALDKAGTIELGGYRVKLGPTAHNGSDRVELTVLGAQGLYRR